MAVSTAFHLPGARKSSSMIPWRSRASHSFSLRTWNPAWADTGLLPWPTSSRASISELTRTPTRVLKRMVLCGCCNITGKALAHCGESSQLKPHTETLFIRLEQRVRATLPQTWFVWFVSLINALAVTESKLARVGEELAQAANGATELWKEDGTGASNGGPGRSSVVHVVRSSVHAGLHGAAATARRASTALVRRPSAIQDSLILERARLGADPD